MTNKTQKKRINESGEVFSIWDDKAHFCQLVSYSSNRRERNESKIGFWVQQSSIIEW
jgi:hypothetical protein